MVAYSYGEMADLCDEMLQELPKMDDKCDRPILTIEDIGTGRKFDDEIAQAWESFFWDRSVSDLSPTILIHLAFRLEFAKWSLGEMNYWHPDVEYTESIVVSYVAGCLTDHWHLSSMNWLICQIGLDPLFGDRELPFVQPTREDCPILDKMLRKYSIDGLPE